MNRRSFLSLAAGAPLAAIIPGLASAKGCGPATIAATSIHATKIAAGSIGCKTLSAISAQLANVPIRNATISPLAVFASNIGAGSITDERIKR